MLIRFYGHFQLQTGYGHAARELAKALDAVFVGLELVTVGPRPSDWKPYEVMSELDDRWVGRGGGWLG